MHGPSNRKRMPKHALLAANAKLITCFRIATLRSEFETFKSALLPRIHCAATRIFRMTPIDEIAAFAAIVTVYISKIQIGVNIPLCRCMKIKDLCSLKALNARLAIRRLGIAHCLQIAIGTERQGDAPVGIKRIARRIQHDIRTIRAYITATLNTLRDQYPGKRISRVVPTLINLERRHRFRKISQPASPPYGVWSIFQASLSRKRFPRFVFRHPSNARAPRSNHTERTRCASNPSSP